MAIKLNLDPKVTYILAVSGGIDSMVLFDLFIKHGYKFVVVHFNHQKRNESIKDHQLIHTLCLHHKVPYHYIKLNIKSGNFQEMSRNQRYIHLEEIADTYQTPFIVTAHHLDDLAETILMKLIRGSNLLGYSGMQAVAKIEDYVYLKPLLSYSKASIKTYQTTHQIQYLEDHTNLEDTYLRNRIRHHLIPLLKDENDVLTHFKNFSTQSYLASDFIRQHAKSFLKLDLSFNLKAFNLLHEVVQMDVIALIFETLNIDKTFKKITTIIRQLSSTKPNIDITLNKDFRLIKAYENVWIHQSLTPNDSLSDNHLMISHNKVELPSNSVELCYNKLDFPIHLRKRNPGDKLSFTFGRKKLKDFLIDKKIPLHERNNLNIIVDSSGTILWIPGLYLNETLGSQNKVYLAIKE